MTESIIFHSCGHSMRVSFEPFSWGADHTIVTPSATAWVHLMLVHLIIAPNVAYIHALRG